MTAPVRTPTLLEVKDLSIAYGPDISLVQDLSFSIARGRLWASWASRDAASRSPPWQ